MIDQDLFTELINRFVTNQGIHNSELTLDLMILCQLLNLKQKIGDEEPSFELYSPFDLKDLEDLEELENSLDSMVEENRKKFNEVLNLLKKKN